MKTVDINECILLMLYRQDPVCLSGIGTIRTRYRQANIDHVKGSMSAPGIELTFSPDELSDDGMLLREISIHHQLSREEASIILTDFLLTLKATLGRNDMFSITGVGRLYHDYQQQIKFISDGDNVNPESFGLPVIQAEPVSRKPSPGDISISEPVKKKTRQTWWQRNLTLMVFLLVALVSAGIYLALSKKLSQMPLAAESLIPEDKVNVSPPAEPEDEPQNQPDDFDEDNEPEPPIPVANICTIRIGRFGNPDNVARLSQKAMELGLNPYTKDYGKLTEIGVTFEYENQADINAILRVVRKELSKDAIVDKK
jgi:nucleoid DNA-binding protein